MGWLDTLGLAHNSPHTPPSHCVMPRCVCSAAAGWGMFVAVCAMVYAGVLEAWRLSLVRAAPQGLDAGACPPHCLGADGDLAASASASRALLRGEQLPGSFLPAAGAGAAALPWLGWPLQGVRALLGAGGAVGDGTCAQLCAPHSSELNIFWQAPSYLIIGLSEVFTSIGQLEFFYDQVRACVSTHTRMPVCMCVYVCVHVYL